jgi:HCO3- transporter family
MAPNGESTPQSALSSAVSSTSTMVPTSGRSSSAFDLAQKRNDNKPSDEAKVEPPFDNQTPFEKTFVDASNETYTKMSPQSRRPFTQRLRAFSKNGKLRPFRLLRQDARNIRRRYVSDWTLFNQLLFASAVYVFFTNILPGITFASDLHVLTGMTWGAIEIVFSTGLCGIIFALWVLRAKDMHYGTRR